MVIFRILSLSHRLAHDNVPNIYNVDIEHIYIVTNNNIYFIAILAFNEIISRHVAYVF